MTASRRQVATYQAIVGCILGQIRRARGFPQHVVADRVLLDRSTLSRIERGDSPLSLPCLRDLCRVLRPGMEPGDLLRFADKTAKRLEESGIVIITRAEQSEAHDLVLSAGMLLRAIQDLEEGVAHAS